VLGIGYQWRKGRKAGARAERKNGAEGVPLKERRKQRFTSSFDPDEGGHVGNKYDDDDGEYF
jgi:hypothetical protein